MSVLSTGSVLGDFRVEDEVGRGGMGVVYRAVQISLGRPVALKVIAGTLSDNIAFRDRFVRESRLTASLDHPNVIPVFAAGEAAGVLYIAMRFVDGTDLRSLIAAEERLDPLRAAGVMAQVASALEAAHERGLVHRDVKPANVLVAARGGGEHVYLTDFGLTKRSASESGLTSAGEWVGTLDYVAPEQLRGDPVDGRADVYALGCVLYETLTGQVPFPREDDVAKLWAHISDTPPLATELAPDVPRRLAGVARRAMEKDPDDRFASARDMGRAGLVAVPGGGDTGARARLAASRTAPSRTRRRPAWRALLAALAVLGALAGVAALVLSGDDDAAEDDASGRARGARAVAAPGAEIVGRSIPVGDAPSGIAVTPAGGIWVANTGAESVTFIDSRRPRVRSRIPVGEDPKAIAAGPASVWVANFGDASVTRIDIRSRRAIATIPLDAAPVDLAAVTDIVWVATEDDRVLRIDARSNQPAQDVTAVKSVGALALSGDRLWVLDTFDGLLSSIDARSGLVTGPPVPVGRLPADVAAGTTGAWVSVAGDGVVRGVPVSASEPKTIGVGGRPEYLALDRRWLWATDSERDVVIRVDGRSGKMVGGPVRVPEDPAGIAAGRDGGVWVTSAEGDSVTRLEPR
jgi:serine/threonine protein kinase/DNA-binding beta-propeller fold protein YncE